MNLRRAAFAVVVVVFAVVGCTRLVDGRALAGAPRPGTPVQWSTCKPASPDSRVPAGAECGLLSVPVDYAKPDGDVAQIAMVRFKATGEKIGSLIVNPGGPGESGRDLALNL